MKLRILLASLTLGLTALAAETGAELFQKAVTAERAAGNLEEAIKLYQRVAKEFASDRSLAAKALVQEARCYEKLGQDKAVKIYEQVARDYRDQREPSATASARLVVLRQGDRAAVPATISQRKIELPYPDTSLFTDGRREVYQEDTGALMISDLAGKDKRLIFKPKAGDRVVSYLPSRDLSILVVATFGTDRSIRLATIKTDGTGYREFGMPISQSVTVNWSWDNRYLYVWGSQPDGTHQLLRVSVTDGEIRKVRATDNEVHRPSPDGRFIASASSSTSGKVFVMPSEGGEPQLVSDSARLIDWTRDGRYLVIANARSGSEALYLLPIKDGGPAGDPVFVRYGPCKRGSINVDGALVCQATLPSGTYAAWLGSLDSGGRLVDWKRLNLGGNNSSTVYPKSLARWSPDSTQIAYATPVEAAGRNTWAVRLRNIATGQERELYRGSSSIPTVCVWAAQHPNLFCAEFNPPNTQEVFSVSIDSGRVERLGSFTQTSYWNPYYVSDDDRAIYMGQYPGDDLIRWDISTQQVTTVGPMPGTPVIPNTHWIAAYRDKGTIEVRPTPGGDWKPLISLSPTQVGLTPDGNWLFYHDVDAAGKHGLFRVSLTGGRPDPVGDFPIVRRDGGILHISPDGQKIIAEALMAPDVWLLENFEPKQQAAR